MAIIRSELVILQSRSPSCGVNHIYDGMFSGKLKSGHGLFIFAAESKEVKFENK